MYPMNIQQYCTAPLKRKPIYCKQGEFLNYNKTTILLRNKLNPSHCGLPIKFTKPIIAAIDSNLGVIEGLCGVGEGLYSSISLE